MKSSRIYLRCHQDCSSLHCSSIWHVFLATWRNLSRHFLHGKCQITFEAVEIAIVHIHLFCSLSPLEFFLVLESAPTKRKLTRQIASQENISAVSFEQIQVLAFAVVGILILPVRCHSFLTAFTCYFHYINEVELQNHREIVSWLHFTVGGSLLISVGNFAKAGAGCLKMFFGAHGFTRLLAFHEKFRNAEAT